MRPAHFYHAFDVPYGRFIYEEHLNWLARTEFPAEPRVTWVGPGEGYEQATLVKLRAWAIEQDKDVPVLYAHTKGASHPDEPYSVWWRVGMTAHVVGHWRRCIELLADHDAVGVHWLSDKAYFDGNFWWSKSSYLASLAEPATNCRDEAETWLGTGNPRVADLHPVPKGPQAWGVRWDYRRRAYVQDLTRLMPA